MGSCCGTAHSSGSSLNEILVKSRFSSGSMASACSGPADGGDMTEEDGDSGELAAMNGVGG